MKHLSLLVLLTATLSMTACGSDSYHRAFHHPFQSHDEWLRDHSPDDRDRRLQDDRDHRSQDDRDHRR
jgi:hypothetical protein